MSQPPTAQQQQQVIYLVMDENNQTQQIGQQIQFINGQPTLVMAQDGQAMTTSGSGESQVLLVSEDGQLVTGNEGQVVLDERGQVVMTTDEGQQVALETEHLNVGNQQSEQIEYMLTSEAVTTPKSSILSQAASIITGDKTPNGSATKDEDDDGYTTIMIGGGQTEAATSEGYSTLLVDSLASTVTATSTSHPNHPILSTQLTASPANIIKSTKTVESPRAMVSILNKARLASMTQQKAKPAVVPTVQSQVVTSPAETQPLILQDPVVTEGQPEPEGVKESEVVEAPLADEALMAPDEDLNETEQAMEVDNVPLASSSNVEAAPEEPAQADEAVEKPEETEEAAQEPAEEAAEPAKAGKDATEDATEMAKSLDEYMTDRPAPVEEEEERQVTQGGVGTGTVLGPLRYDSDDSGLETFDEPRLTIATYEQKGKKGGGDKQTESESDSGSRRRSSRNKSPKRYSEEPIIFGDDWAKPENKAEDGQNKPRKKPWFTYEEIESSESDGEKKLDDERRKQPPKKRLSSLVEGKSEDEKETVEEPRKGNQPASQPKTGEKEDEGPTAEEEVSPRKRGRPPLHPKTDEKKEEAAEVSPRKRGRPPLHPKPQEKKEETAAEPSPRKRGRPPKKRFLEKHNSEEGIREEADKNAEPKGVLSKVAEKKLSEGTKKDMLDNFGFDEDSEKEEGEVKAPEPKKPDTILVQKMDVTPVVLSVDKPVIKHISGKGAQWESPLRGDVEVIPTSGVKATDLIAARSAAKVTPSSETKAKPRYSDIKLGSPKKALPLGTTSGGDRKLGIDFKNMKFSVSKRISSQTPEAKKSFGSAKKISPNTSKTPKTVEGKGMADRDAALSKREQKIKALDKELDERAAQLKVKEAKLERLQRKLKETESNLEYRERRIKREELALDAGSSKDGGSKRAKKGKDDGSQEMKEWESRLAAQEKELDNRERKLQAEEKELKKKQQLMAATEKELTSLSRDLAEKYHYLQDQDPELVAKVDKKAAEPRQGLFERLANLSQRSEVSSHKRKAESSEEEEEEEEKSTPVRKRAKVVAAKGRKSVENSDKKQSSGKQSPEGAMKRGRGRPRKVVPPEEDAPSQEPVPTGDKAVASEPQGKAPTPRARGRPSKGSITIKPKRNVPKSSAMALKHKKVQAAKVKKTALAKTKKKGRQQPGASTKAKNIRAKVQKKKPPKGAGVKKPKGKDQRK